MAESATYLKKRDEEITEAFSGYSNFLKRIENLVPSIKSNEITLSYVKKTEPPTMQQIEDDMTYELFKQNNVTKSLIITYNFNQSAGALSKKTSPRKNLKLRKSLTKKSPSKKGTLKKV